MGIDKSATPVVKGFRQRSDADIYSGFQNTEKTMYQQGQNLKTHTGPLNPASGAIGATNPYQPWIITLVSDN